MKIAPGDDDDIEMDEDVEVDDRQSAIEKIQILLGDDDKTVIEALYSHIEQSAAQFLEALTPSTYIAAIAPAFDTNKPVPAIRSQHLAFISRLDSATLNKADSVNVFMSLVFPSLLATANRPCFSQGEWSILEQGFFKTHELTSSNELKKAIGHAKSANTSDKVEGTALNPILVNAVAGESFFVSTITNADMQHRSLLHTHLLDTRLLLSHVFRALFPPLNSWRILSSVDSWRLSLVLRPPSSALRS